MAAATTSASSSAQITAFQSLVCSLATDADQLLSTSTQPLASQLTAPDDAKLAQHRDAFLTLKSTLLLSYTQHLVLLSSHKLLGHSISSDANGHGDDEEDGGDGGDGAQLVRNLVRMRLVLEKMRAVESRLRPRYERMIRASDLEEQKQKQGGAAVHEAGAGADENEDEDLDALAFRPNPSALLGSSAETGQDTRDARRSASASGGVYRPPKMAAVPYNESSRARKTRRGSPADSDDSSGGGGGRDADPDAPLRSSRRSGPSNAHLLHDMTASLSATPAALSASGLSAAPAGSAGAGSSARARRLREMEDYEESNFTRLVQSKKEMRKRRRDEEDVALGGATTAGLGRGSKKVGAGLEEEFGDLLRGGERGGKGGQGSRKEWDELTKKRRKGALPPREAGKGKGKAKPSASGSGSGSGNRFEKAVKSHAKRK